MALITCPECGRQISEYSTVCIGCGVPMEMIKKLLAESEPSPTAIAAFTEVSEEPAQVQTEHSESISTDQMKSRMVNCIICGTNFGIADHHCPKCNYSVLSLSPKPDLNAITELKTKYREESELDLSKPLLTRVYTFSDTGELATAISNETLNNLIADYETYVNEGNLIAKANLGILYCEGLGVKEDIAAGIALLKDSAEKGIIEAQFWLGLLFAVDEKNNKEAKKWALKAANQGDVESQSLLGDIYDEEGNHTEAAKWYRKAANQGDAPAQYSLGELYKRGKGVEQNYIKAAEWYHKAAEQGNPNAQHDLGILYENGQGVKQDYTKAEEWYRKAVENGDANAAERLVNMNKDPDPGDAEIQYDLGLSYSLGDEVEQNYAKAAAWYRKAAEQGHADAQESLGFLYEMGEGVEQDYRKASEWYIKAASQGHSEAQRRLGELYENGHGIERDYKRAEKWYLKAAEQGNSLAWFSLSSLYYYDLKDYTKAAEWTRKGAENGDVVAQYFLGRLYENGSGVEQSYIKAAEWYQKAAEQGYADAAEKLAKLKKNKKIKNF